MKVLWDSGPATPAELVGRLAEDEIELAESTVRTMLGILRDKGYVRTERRGRAYTYHPLVDREEASLSAVRHMVSRFFDGSPGELVLNLLEAEELDAEELARIRRFIEEAERDE